MRVQITERHCDVPRDIRERAETQMEALAKFSPRATAAEVVFMEEKVTRVVEVIVHIDGDPPVIARADDKEFQSALDKVVERVGRQLREQRSLRTDHQAPPRRDRAGRG